MTLTALVAFVPHVLAQLTCTDVQSLFRGNGDPSLTCCGSADPNQLANLPQCSEDGLKFPLASLHLGGHHFNTNALPYEPASLDVAYKTAVPAMAMVNAARGTTHCGMKAGLTALATQQAYGISQPLFGLVHCEAQLPHPATIPGAEWIGAQRFEAEIGYELHAVDPALAPFTSETVKPFLKSVIPSMEVIDFRGFGGSSVPNTFAMANVFYKNTVQGTAVPWTESVQSSLDALSVDVYVEGVFTKSGSASAVEPSLLEVVAQALNHAATYGIPMLENSTIITGSFVGVNPVVETAAIDFGPEFGWVNMTIQ